MCFHRVVKKAAGLAGIGNRIGGLSLKQYATYLLESGIDNRAVQELAAHSGKCHSHHDLYFRSQSTGLKRNKFTRSLTMATSSVTQQCVE